MSDTLHILPSDTYFRYRPDTNEPLPTVVHVPGFNEDALSPAPFALRLARVGFQCVALNPPWRDTPDLNSPSPAILFDLLAEGNALLDSVLEQLHGDRGTRRDWFALTGFSMGGMFVAQTLVRDTRHSFQAAAMVLATGDWSFIPRSALDAFPELRAALPPEALALSEAAIRAQSPIATPHHFPPTPLLLINADRDPRLPLAVAQGFHDALQPLYKAAGAADSLHFDVHQGERHEFRRAMQRQVRDWLVERKGRR